MDDLEETFITEYNRKVSIPEVKESPVINETQEISIKKTLETKSSDNYESELVDENNYEDGDYEGEETVVENLEFQKFDVPLFDKNAWDDSALIQAWDLAINQRDNPEPSSPKPVSGSQEPPKKDASNESEKQNKRPAELYGRNPTTKSPKRLFENTTTSNTKKKLQKQDRKSTPHTPQPDSNNQYSNSTNYIPSTEQANHNQVLDNPSLPIQAKETNILTTFLWLGILLGTTLLCISPRENKNLKRIARPDRIINSFTSRMVVKMQTDKMTTSLVN